MYAGGRLQADLSSALLDAGALDFVCGVLHDATNKSNQVGILLLQHKYGTDSLCDPALPSSRDAVVS